MSVPKCDPVLPYFLREELIKIAAHLMTPGKGIIALDQSISTMGMRLEDINVENSAENRQKFRELVALADNLEEFTSGIIFGPDAFNTALSVGGNFVEYLKRKGIISGIKLELGLIPLNGSEGECTSAGLDDLLDLSYIYKKTECHFAKCRCVYRVADNLPSPLAISYNANFLARYAIICQRNRMVPIIEPEILPEGKHSLDRAQKVAETVLAALFYSLRVYNVALEGLILKVNFVTPGMLSTVNYTPQEIAMATATALSRTVPPAVQGIVFLAGGSSEEEATTYLDYINQPMCRCPWPMSFSFGRGMLTSALQTWAGEDNNVAEARQVLLMRAQKNSLASVGKYVYEQKMQILELRKEEDKKSYLLGKYEKYKTIKTRLESDNTIDEN